MRILVLTTFKRINSRIVKTLRKKSLLISKGRFRATVVYERTDIKSQQFTTEESKSIVMTTARSWAFWKTDFLPYTFSTTYADLATQWSHLVQGFCSTCKTVTVITQFKNSRLRKPSSVGGCWPTIDWELPQILNLIGWESSVSFPDKSHGEVKENQHTGS